MSDIVTIRPGEHRDREALCGICLKTGDAGRDATALYRDADLIGQIYAAPYLSLAPDLALVAEDHAGVLGYAVGAAETRAFEARLERDWWPGLRARYREPAGERSGWTADERRIWSFHHPARVPDDIVGTFPAHIHMNLLARAQGRGIGTRLLGAWLDRARRSGIRAVHAGVGAANEAGLAFWKARGFKPVRTDLTSGSSGTVWCGRAV
ncbi:GNAT family N-acetyltransferase [Roseibium sp. AS2]|uniref:GNAT family N-acetyltransferase n=1 Tax=Roseibium sp. AS2 TaxID=3135781 RepID=UPI0031783C5A